MLRFTRPSPGSLAGFLAQQARHDFTYRDVGLTREGKAPDGWFVNRHRVRVGSGESDFFAARAAVEDWKIVDDTGWVAVFPPGAKTEPGQELAIVAGVLGFWWVSACRIVYNVSEERGPVVRHCVGYGTLPDHAARGEERFLVDWDRDDDSVWYEVFSFSRPRGLLARVGLPYLRLRQRGFSRDSAAAVSRAVADSGAAVPAG